MHDNPDKQTSTDIVQTEYKSMQKQIPVDAGFSGPVQTGPGAHPAFCKMGNGSLSRGVKWQGLCVNHPLPSSAGVKERVELYLFRLWAFMACYRANFTFTFTFYFVSFAIDISCVTIELSRFGFKPLLPCKLGLRYSGMLRHVSANNVWMQRNINRN